jgi:tetratricopeptide (TPR) repeat protein
MTRSGATGGRRPTRRTVGAWCAFLLIGSWPARATGAATANPYALFADSLMVALNEGDSEFVDLHTDTAVFNEALRAAEPLPARTREFVEASAAGIRRLGAVVLQETTPKTTFALVRIDAGDNGERILLCRMHGEAMLAYVRVALVLRGTQVMIADWHNLATGVSVRESLRFWTRTLQAEADAPQSAGGRRSGRSGSVPALFARLQAGDATGAEDELRKLPAKTAEHPIVVAARIAAARSAGAESRRQLFEWLAHSRRRAQRYSLLLVDYYMAQNEYRRALRAADGVERAVGREAGVDCLRAAIYGASGRTAAAYSAFADAIEQDPAFEAAYWRLLDLLVADGKFADATLVLDVLAVKFEYEFDVDEFSEVESYRTFVRSSEFRRWAEEWEQ